MREQLPIQGSDELPFFDLEHVGTGRRGVRAGTQRCMVCGVEHPLSEFYADTRSSTGCRKNCKGCHKAAVRAFQTSPAGSEKRRTYERSLAGRARKARHRAQPEIKKKEREYFKQKLRSDPASKLGYLLRVRVLGALKRRQQQKRGRVVQLLGCDIEFLQLYLEMQFKPGMSWENHGHTTWHIDHRRPLAAFDLDDPAQLATACHFSNLQPLWAFDNLSKGART